MNAITQTVTQPELYEFQNVADFNADGVADAVRVARLKTPSLDEQKNGFDEVDMQAWVATVVFMNADGSVQSESTADDLNYGCSIAESLNDPDKIAMVSLRADLNGDGKKDMVSIERESYSIEDYQNGVTETDDLYTGLWLLKQNLTAPDAPMGVAQAPKKSVADIKPCATEPQTDLVSRGPVIVRFN